jgi:hypothetical protein
MVAVGRRRILQDRGNKKPQIPIGTTIELAASLDQPLAPNHLQ